MAKDRDALAPQQYRSKHPPAHYRKFYRHARKHDPKGFVYLPIKVVLWIFLQVFPGVKVIGKENIPRTGPVIFSPNHFSFMDHFAVGVMVHFWVRFVAKSQLFDIPVARWIFKEGGVIPMCRGYRDEESFSVIKWVLSKGQAIVMYWEGGRSRSHEVGEKAKYGVGRVSLETGAPIVPVAIYGTQFLRYWRWRDRKRWREMVVITIQFGKPMPTPRIDDPTHEQCKELAEAVGGCSRAMCDELERTARPWWLARL